MGWQDRDYNRCGGRNNDYLSNPGAILGLSVPFGRWFGVPVRLHFWLLLTIAMSLASLIHHAPILFVLPSIAILLASLLMHDFGHRLAAQWVGGWHNEFVLWPSGGMVFPTLGPGPWRLFVGYVGGIAINLILFAISSATLMAMAYGYIPISWDPLSVFGSSLSTGTIGGLGLSLAEVLVIIAVINWGLILINLLPFYWFDGGCLLQSILWPWIGCYHAINVTCILGMLIAGPLVIYSMSVGNFMGMVFWALLFSSSYTKRREVVASGTGELEQTIAYSAGNQAPSPRKRGKAKPDFAAQMLERKQAAERQQEMVDKILAKVSAKGMHSLSAGDRKILKDATERTRRDGML